MWKPLQQHFFAVVNQHRTAFTTALLNAAADSYGCSCASFSFVSLILWLICLGVFFIDFLSCFIVLSDHSSDFSLSEDLGLFTIFTSFLFLNHLYVWSIFFFLRPTWDSTVFFYYGPFFCTCGFWMYSTTYFWYYLFVVNVWRIFALCEMFCYELLLMRSWDSLMVWSKPSYFHGILWWYGLGQVISILATTSLWSDDVAVPP